MAAPFKGLKAFLLGWCRTTPAVDGRFMITTDDLSTTVEIKCTSNYSPIRLA